MTEWTIITNSYEETMRIAERLGKIAQRGDVITLEGDLGAGKTTFTKGLAQGLGVKRIVNSPTFTIIKEYNGRIPLYHMDVYRLEDSLEELGLDEYFYGDGVSVIEWASMIEDQLPEDRLEFFIYHLNDTSRKINIRSIGKRSAKLLEELRNE